MNDTEGRMEPGDGVLYQGNLVKHYRKAFKGIECIQMFLHYVDADGPFKDHVFDIQRIKTRPEPLWFRFAKADRKSTRLNSSHLGISYAVFCWKKKNKP